MAKKVTSALALKELSRQIAQMVLEISYRAKAMHVGSSLSVVELLTVLYFSRLNSSDRFILSKGHAVAALYAVLHKKGVISKKELFTFGQNKGLCGHPLTETKGVDMSTGSLGHGLGFGMGIALGFKKQNKKGFVYVLISDGECNEGSVWEAALLAPKLKLDNLVVILDYNNWQCFGRTNDIISAQPMRKKWESFGWEVSEINGHRVQDIQKAFFKLPQKKDCPSIVIAHTIAGKGIPLIEDKQAAHYKVFNSEEYSEAQNQLKKS